MNKQMNSVRIAIKDSVVVKRLGSDKPTFWKRIRKYAIIGTIIAGGATAFVSVIGAPVWVIAIIASIDAMCVSTITNASLTTSNPELSKK